MLELDTPHGPVSGASEVARLVQVEWHSREPRADPASEAVPYADPLAATRRRIG
jgi:hypothetical protein